PTLGQMVTQSARESAGGAPGPLVLVVGSDIYVYDAAGAARLGGERFGPARPGGFYELTAISHIGPALAYLAQIKANGDARWQTRLASLRPHTAPGPPPTRGAPAPGGSPRPPGPPPTTGSPAPTSRRGARARRRSATWWTMRARAP